MTKTVLSIGIGVIACAAVANDLPAVDGGRVRAHTRFLSSDLLEGRGTGARGGDLATEYLATQFALAGAKPAGDNGTYFQSVPLVGVETGPGARLAVRAGGKEQSFTWLEQFVGTSHRQRGETQFSGAAVFVGHGIVAPEFGWNDYAGVDVKGKVAIAFTNEPPSTDEAFFGGRALTYYGRWTYKFEEALRQGAAAMLLIHTDGTAGYGWNVVRNSWGREEPYVKLAGGEPALAFAGWVRADAAGPLLGGRSVEDLLKAADAKGFKPFALEAVVRGTIPTQVRELKTRNVVAAIPGSDPSLASEHVLFSAHWDHLGVAAEGADKIFNGAVDNATGCAVLLELARAWALLPQKPRRTAVFVAVTAEEGGLRGSEYYSRKPFLPIDKVVVALNYDALYPFGRPREVVVTGAEKTALWPLVQHVAKQMDLGIQADPRPEQGSYFRSDHYSFARRGAPAFSVKGGAFFRGRPEAEQWMKEYGAKHYHQPSDEFREEWDFSGVAELGQFGLKIAIEAANR